MQRSHEDVERVLKDFERRWAPELESVSLIAEVQVPEHEVTELVEALRWLNRHKHTRLLSGLHNVPACVAAVLTSTAVESYAAGAFWPNFFDRIGISQNPQDQQAWGKAFLRALDQFSLPRFASSKHRFLGPILAHAGIPNYCLGDYFAALDQAMRRVGADADSVASWAVPRVDTALANFDVPVRRFLERGDEFTVDFIDRSMDLMIRLNRDEDPSATLLPDKVIEAARDYLESATRRGIRLGVAQGSGVEARATVSLDPVDGELRLTLPAMEAIDVDLVWSVSIDDATQFVTPAKRMGGRTIGIREATLPIRHPARSIRVGSPSVEQVQEIDLVDPQDPILFFSEAGQPLPSHLPLPGGQVWALYAMDGGANPAFEERIIYAPPAPLGWNGWKLALVDLQGAHQARLSPSHPAHSVRNDARVTLETTSTVDHIRSGGAPVHRVRPSLRLPDGADAVWRLNVVNVSTGETVRDREVTSSADAPSIVDPFEGLRSPVVGRFAITMRGPLGKGLSRTVSVAEGLTASCSLKLRTFVPGGLDVCTVRLMGPDLTLDHPVLRFEPSVIEKSTVVQHGQDQLEVLVTPPAMAVALAIDGAPDGWAHTVISCATEDIARATVHVRLPSEASTEARVVNDAGVTLQVLTSDTRMTRGEQSASHVAVFDLGQASDVIRAAGSCTLIVGTSPSIRLARIAPEKLAQGALSLSFHTIQLIDYSGGPVRARLWSLWEPWLGAHDIDVPEGGAVSVPDALLGCGSLALHLYVEDPWVPQAPPESPDRFSDLFIRISPDGTRRDSTRALAQGIASVPALPFDKAWALLRMRAYAPRKFFPDRVVESLTTKVREHPTEALLKLSEDAAPVTENIQLLVSSGLLWTEVEDAETLRPLGLDDAAYSVAVARTPAVGALLAGRRLATAMSPQTMPETWEAALSSIGEPFRQILAGETDPAAGVGVLQGTHWLDEKTHGEYQQLLSELNVVPKALLEEDSRISGAIELFDQRRHGAVKRAARDAWALTNLICEKLEEIGAGSLVSAVTPRRVDRHRELPVAHLSSLSIALALFARLAARGEPNCKSSIGAIRDYLDTLSRYAPRLLAVDVALAEAQICAFLATDHPTFKSVEDEQ